MKRKNEKLEWTVVYVVLKGINYGDPEKRVEPGEEVSDLPPASIPWLLEQGFIKRKETR